MDITSDAREAQLREQLRELGHQRRKLSDRVATRRVVEAAIAAVERDMVARTSPDLDRLRDTADQLLRRLSDTRSRSDHTMRLAAALVDTTVAPDGTTTTLRQVRELRAAASAHQQLREHTDQIGR